MKDGVEWVMDERIRGGGEMRNIGINGINGFVNLCGGKEIKVERV